MRKIHFIAIGGAAMHNLAIALKNMGYEITGSDDEIFEPASSHLRDHGLLPDKIGWDQQRISKKLDGVILGMHARADNPELLKAQELGIKIYSYPEFLYEQTKNKKRVVIAGSHGKTTITAMVIHVLTQCNIVFDFMVGSQIDGFDTMVSLSDHSKIAVFEGDEYLSSPIDLRPKFMHYKPHIALISGISWDHINVFPTFEVYKEQFTNLVKSIEDNGNLVYYAGDENVATAAKEIPEWADCIGYTEHNSNVVDGKTYLITDNNTRIPLSIFGRHNLQNLNGARIICKLLGITDGQFYKTISTFAGTAKRLQVLKKASDHIIYLDFAHAPSKVKATVQAAKEQYPDRKLVAIFELHTFSSLNKDYLPQYAGTLDMADMPIVFYNNEVVAHKKLSLISEDFIQNCFNNKKIEVITVKLSLETLLSNLSLHNTVLLLMSSGNFAGIDLPSFFKKL